MTSIKHEKQLFMKKRILYIEDDPDMAEIIAEIMEYEHYEVTSDSGKRLFQILENEHIGLILMDEGLSWCRGSDLCRQLKKKKETSHIPVIMISAARNLEYITADCGATSYIKKPFDMYDIIDLLDQHYPN